MFIFTKAFEHLARTLERAYMVYTYILIQQPVSSVAVQILVADNGIILPIVVDMCVKQFLFTLLALVEFCS